MQLFNHANTGRFLLLPLEGQRRTLAIFLVYLEFLLPTMEIRKATHSTNRKQGKAEQILFV
jgi:hypothetical protein